MRRLWIFELPILVALSGVLSGPLVAPPKAAAYDDGDYSDRYRDFDDDSDDALGAETTFRYFRDELAPYGEWVKVPTYGWAWRPNRVGPDWQPYTVGRWIDTDYGWTWVSDEPWGRRPYHYGRWYWDRQYGGWVWVPGRRWAPAWVDWREGDRYWGWAPLPPTAAWQPGVGIPTRTITIDPHRYRFVEKRYIVEPNIHRYIAPPARNVTIIHNTTNVTNYTIVNHRVANHSIREATVEKAIGRQVPRYPIAEVENATPRAFHKPEAPGAPARNAEQHEPRRGIEARSTAPPAAAEGHGRAQVDHDRADAAEHERADRQAREREATQREQAERSREAVRQQVVQQQEAAGARAERGKAEQEAARRQQAEAERSREAAHQQAAQQQEAARARAERGKAEQEAARQQAEAERRRAPRPHPQPQPQQQPQRQQQPDPRDGH